MEASSRRPSSSCATCRHDRHTHTHIRIHAYTHTHRHMAELVLREMQARAYLTGPDPTGPDWTRPDPTGHRAGPIYIRPPAHRQLMSFAHIHPYMHVHASIHVHTCMQATGPPPDVISFNTVIATASLGPCAARLTLHPSPSTLTLTLILTLHPHPHPHPRPRPRPSPSPSPSPSPTPTPTPTPRQAGEGSGGVHSPFSTPW